MAKALAKPLHRVLARGGAATVIALSLFSHPLTRGVAVASDE